ncbi:MAG: hypothetical protein JWO33_1658 [Caulobacteraceae bacterium]|nr:hypothetical protein [Caulobacteraceae bacterium]
MTLRDMLLCSGFSIALPIGQSLFKWAAVYNERLSGPLPLRLISNPPLLGAFAWYGMTALFWFYILTRTPLSTAYAFAIMGSGLVPLIAWLVFKEPMSWRFILGFAVMMAGLLVVVSGQRQS